VNVTVIYNPNRPGGSTVRVHRTGCRDIGRDSAGATTVYAMDADDKSEVVWDFSGDLIREGSSTYGQALGEVDFLPCAPLPEGNDNA